MPPQASAVQPAAKQRTWDSHWKEARRPALTPTGASLVSFKPMCSSPMGKAGWGSAVIHSLKPSCRPSGLARMVSTCAPRPLLSRLAAAVHC